MLDSCSLDMIVEKLENNDRFMMMILRGDLKYSLFDTSLFLYERENWSLILEVNIRTDAIYVFSDLEFGTRERLKYIGDNVEAAYKIVNYILESYLKGVPYRKYMQK